MELFNDQNDLLDRTAAELFKGKNDLLDRTAVELHDIRSRHHAHHSTQSAK